VLAGLDVLGFAKDEGQKVDYEHVQLPFVIQVIQLRKEAVPVVFLQQHLPVGVYAHPLRHLSADPADLFICFNHVL
jgi:hypothetical protein